MTDEDLERTLNRAVQQATVAAAPFMYAYIRLLVCAALVALALVCGSAVACKYLTVMEQADE